MKRMLLTFVLVLVFAPAVTEAAKPILNKSNVPVPLKTDGTSYTADEVQAVIMKGCVARRWSPEVQGEGLIRATITVRGKHSAEIEIPYTSAAYSIRYVSSNNLDYNERKQSIHRNYNGWVVKLSGTIDKMFVTPPSKAASTPAQASPTAPAKSNQDDMVSKLLELEYLRDRGTLTEEEFQAAKKKILERN